MGWFGFPGLGQTPQQRSYHARGGVSRAMAHGSADEPMSVEDVVRSQTFWRQYRGQVIAFLFMGFGGFLVTMVMSFADGVWNPGWDALIVGVLTLALLVMPLIFWSRFQQQRRLYEQIAAQTAPHEPPDA
jgi:hypothetical protein